MNLCFIALDYPTATAGSGVGNQVRALAADLVRAGHRVTVVALARPGDPRFVDDHGIQVHRVPRGRLHWYVSKAPLLGSLASRALRELEDGWVLFRLVWRLHRRAPFDVVEGTETGSLVTALLLRDVPLVTRLHGEHYTFHRHTPDVPLTRGIRLGRVLQRAALRRSRALISPSRSHAAEISSELRSRHPPITIIPNTVSWPLDVKAPADRAPGIVLFVGRLDRYKGVPLLLDAARRVVRSMPRACFVFAGGSHPTLQDRDLAELVRRHALQRHVRFLGHVSREEIRSRYTRAAVCVLPSYYETFGLAALEAMSLGVPVVATAAGALPEVVEHGVTGVLVPPGDAERLAEAIVALLGDPSLRRAMGRAGVRRAAAHFNPEDAARAALAVYAEAGAGSPEAVS